ncbi:monocarboxylate transporter 8-like [Mercenaria mercenaria]|uniref:monocarboxylate transporter 8-like n=1 Tax=Mercenaria mercenaria TaxID=6596 RepID=UPI00234EABA3|nr:monocarboxylate transporter 8-like [Mercenaria mercenaria]
MLYFVTSCVVFLVVYAPATFLPDLMHEFGRSSSEVYSCVMTMGACDLVGRLLSGFLVHKMPSKLALIHSAGIMILCMSSGLIALSKSIGTFVIVSAFLGLGSGCYAGLQFVMSAHLLPIVDVRFGYGLVLTFGGLSLVAGMPLAGFVSDHFKTERGAFIFSSILFFIGSLLELIIGIREICGQKSRKSYAMESVENTAYVADEELQVHSKKRDDVVVVDSSYI